MVPYKNPANHAPGASNTPGVIFSHIIIIIRFVIKKMRKFFWNHEANSSDEQYRLTYNYLEFCFVCLIWFFTSQSTIFQICQDGSSWVEPVLSKD